MTTTTIAKRDQEDQGFPQVKEGAFVLATELAWAIRLYNGRLYREPIQWMQDPNGEQPTVWFQKTQAHDALASVARINTTWYGWDDDLVASLRVVQVEMGADGIWRQLPEVATLGANYAPTDPDTGERSPWLCDSRAELTVDQARQVMRGHRECAGLMPCRIRGRARAVLALAGVMHLNRTATAWLALSLPDQVRA